MALDRAATGRADPAWVAERLRDPDSRAVFASREGVLVREGDSRMSAGSPSRRFAPPSAGRARYSSCRGGSQSPASLSSAGSPPSRRERRSALRCGAVRKKYARPARRLTERIFGRASGRARQARRTHSGNASARPTHRVGASEPPDKLRTESSTLIRSTLQKTAIADENHHAMNVGKARCVCW